MLDKDFYPTPKDLIVKMCEGLELKNKLVLDPSCGKGDILDYVRSKGATTVGIEYNDELHVISSSKGHFVRFADWLKIRKDKSDYIIANPPFSNGDKHLLKMLESENTPIVCLLNAETLKNPYTATRSLLVQKLEKHNASIEYIQNAFCSAERKTGVEIALIRVENKVDKIDFEFDIDFNNEEKVTIDDNVSANQLASNNMIEAIVHGFELSKKTFIDLIKIKNKLLHMQDGVGGTRFIFGFSEHDTSSDQHLYDKYCHELRNSAWENIFAKCGVDDLLTKNAKEKFDKLKQQQQDIDFTEKNIREMILALMQNADNFHQEACEEAFYKLTEYYKENRTHIEGWKTNERWKCSKKFILPYMCDVTLGQFYMFSSNRAVMEDLDKVLCRMTGTKYEYKSAYNNAKFISVETAMNDKSINPHKSGQWFESTFFRIKLFKKGTGHFEFKDENIWKKFNIKACKGKNWLGNSND